MNKQHVGGKTTAINQKEIELYQEYRKKREQIQRGLTSQGVAEGSNDSLSFWKREAQKAGGAANIDWYAIGVEHGKQGIVMNPPYGVGGKAVTLYGKGLAAGQQGVAEGEQMSKTKALNALRKQLMNEYPYMKCENLEEFKQRLQWLSEGMLKNHLTNDKNYIINQEEIALYQEYRKKREHIQQGSQGVAEGKKVDRMVGHIEDTYKKKGKSADTASDIAWATVNKRGYLDNKNKKGK